MALKDSLGTTISTGDTIAVAWHNEGRLDDCQLVIGIIATGGSSGVRVTGGRRWLKVAKGTTAARPPGSAAQDSSDYAKAYLTRVGSDYYAYDAVKSGFSAGQA